MTLRCIISFPGHISAEEMYLLQEKINEAADDRARRDIVISNGGTLTPVPYVPKAPVSALVRRARALHR